MAVSTLRLALAAGVGYAAYAKVFRWLLAGAKSRGARLGPRWLGVYAWTLFNSWSRLVGVRLVSEGGEGLKLVDPARRYMIVWHPHGFIAWAPSFICGRMAVTGHPHGREWFALVAPVLFKLPVVGEVLALCNARPVDRATTEGLLAAGASVAVQPGGIKEQLVTRHDQEQLLLPPNLGFIRLALQYGVDLLPVYIFGENQTFKRVAGLDRASELLYRWTGIGLPAVTAKFGLPQVGVLPKSTAIHVRWGAPVKVGPPQPSPTEERVEEVLAEYLGAVQKIFDQHAKDCLPPEVASRGLLIKRLEKNKKQK